MFTIINDSNNYNNSYVAHFLLFIINAYSNFRLKINIIWKINIFHITSSDIKICDERNNILSANIYIVMTYVIFIRMCVIFQSTYTETSV